MNINRFKFEKQKVLAPDYPSQHALSESEIRIEKSPVFAEKIYPEVEWELAKVG